MKTSSGLFFLLVSCLFVACDPVSSFHFTLNNALMDTCTVTLHHPGAGSESFRLAPGQSREIFSHARMHKEVSDIYKDSLKVYVLPEISVSYHDSIHAKHHFDSRSKWLYMENSSKRATYHCFISSKDF